MIIKTNIKRSERVIGKNSPKLFHIHYCLDDHSGIEVCDFVFLSNAKHMRNWRKVNILAT